MFDKLLRELEELQRAKSISVPINSDKDGYFDKECPNKECLFQFKVQKDDWKALFKDEKVYCPMCRYEAKSDSWWTTEQLGEAKNQALQHIKGRISQALKDGAIDFNALQPRNSFISISASVSGGNPYHYILPVPAKDEMFLKITCKECSARYAVIGSAFFCPACGHNSAEETFDNSILKIEAKIKNISIIRKAVESISRDEAEITCRSLIETSLNECVVAFQRFCEVTFSKRNPSEKIKLNAFQKLDVGGDYWKNLYGETYQDWLTETEYQILNQLFQKRHLLSHTEGIVDQKYINKSADTSYSIGQRIVVKEKDVLNLKDLINKIVCMLRTRGSITII